MNTGDTMVKPTFKFKDEVIITKGFYRGREGYIKEYKTTKGTSYIVSIYVGFLMFRDSDWIKEKDLRLKTIYDYDEI